MAFPEEGSQYDNRIYRDGVYRYTSELSVGELTVTGDVTLGVEKTLNVNAGSAVITVPVLELGEMKVIRKISSSVGTITINLPATNTFPDGSSSITLTNQWEEVTIERVSATGWRLFSSATGGVLNGAVIEEGSNSNGSWVKFANGTMIANRLNISTPLLNVASGTLFTHAIIILDFPTLFAGQKPTVLGTCQAGGGKFVVSAQVTQGINMAIRVLSPTSYDYGTVFDYTAIGRWK